MLNKHHNSYSSAFTIIELLVVIVIIAILAAITLVAYTGISQEAIKASLKSDLANAATSLKAYNIENSAFPNSISDCPTPSPGNTCLRPTSGNSFSSYSANNTVSPKSFSLTASNGSNIYIVTSNSNPVALATAPLNPVADWLAMSQGEHYGNYYDLVTKQWATVTRAGTKTIYDPSTNKIYDVPANYLGINPRSDGKGGSEAVIEEGRTNYLLHSYFDLDSDSNGLSDGWSPVASNSTNTYSRNTTNSIYGTVQQFRAVHTNGAATGWPSIQQVSATGTFAAGESATITIRYRNISKVGSGVYLQLNPRDSSGTSIGQASTVLTAAADNIWRTATVTYSNLPTNTSKCGWGVNQSQSNDGDMYDIEIAAAQLEKGAFATSYIPTTTAAVTRNADNITVSTSGWNASAQTAFSVAGNCNVNSNCTTLSWRTDGSNNSFLGRNSNTNAYDWAGGVYFSQTGRPTGYSTDALKWTTGGVGYAYINGVPGSASTALPATNTMPSSANIGSYNSGYYFNGPIQRVLVYSSALSDSDITSVTNSIKDGLQ